MAVCEGVERLSHLQDCIMEYLRQHPEGATAKAIAEGIGSRKEVLWTSIRGLERFKLVESRPAGARKIWRAI
jgi:DNA mismatch repair protein MutH